MLILGLKTKTFGLSLESQVLDLTFSGLGLDVTGLLNM
jgi:hypothetical protein